MKRTILLGAIVTALLAAPMVGEAKVSDEQMKEIMAQFQRMWASTDPESKNNGIRRLGECDHPDAVKVLLKLLRYKDGGQIALERQRDQLMYKYDKQMKKLMQMAKASGNNTVPKAEADKLDGIKADLKKIDDQITAGNFVVFNAIKALGQTHDPDALKMVHDGLGDSKWEVRAGCVQALGRAANGSSKSHVRKVISDNEGRVAAPAIDAAKSLNDEDAVDPIIEQLKSKNWQVRTAAVQALGHFKSLKAVGPMIAALQKEKGRLQEDFDAALAKITGFSFGGDPESWNRWWTGNKDRLAEVVKQREKQIKAQAGKGKTTSFYGIETRSKNMCFIIDVSGSMAQKAGKPGGGGPTLSGGKEPAADYPVNGTKMDVANYELMRAVKSLPKDCKFNIIYFSNNINLYNPKAMVTATKGARARCVAWIKATLKPDAMTNSFDALDRAFTLAGRSGKANFAKGVDTVFFLTDGMPTHGRIQDPTKILTEIAMRNKVRKIKIHVIGVGKEGEINLDFLKSLATQNGGTFVHRE